MTYQGFQICLNVCI